MEPNLTIETFLAVSEMVASQLRIKEADRWSANICKLKFVSFQTEFPEVNDQQFLWAAEQWIQSVSTQSFVRYPTWKEIMSPLYRSENGLANRSWGFKEELPGMCRPTPQQLTMLPSAPKSIAPSPDPNNAGAYVPFESTNHPVLPPAETKGLTAEDWANHLESLSDGKSNRPEESEGNP